jgi:general secretion pathway protein A
MYFQFFGIQKHPFGMTPDPAFLYLTPQHREALAGLTYAILGQKGFMALTGDAGTGKTTLLARALQYLPADRIQTSLILNPLLSCAELLEMILLEFGLHNIPASKAQRLVSLEQLLLDADRQNKISALIVDEAHKASPELLEEIRLLGNIEKSDHKLLQILLVGQDELAATINRPELRQLKQRIAARFSLKPLAAVQVQDYVQFRWTKAGGQRKAPFAAEAMQLIASYSKGIPRLVNAICDNALLQAFSESAPAVQIKHVQEAVHDLDLAPAVLAARPRPAPMEQAPPLALSELKRYAEPRSQSFLSRWAGRHRVVN